MVLCWFMWVWCWIVGGGLVVVSVGRVGGRCWVFGGLVVLCAWLVCGVCGWGDGVCVGLLGAGVAAVLGWGGVWVWLVVGGWCWAGWGVVCVGCVAGLGCGCGGCCCGWCVAGWVLLLSFLMVYHAERCAARSAAAAGAGYRRGWWCWVWQRGWTAGAWVWLWLAAGDPWRAGRYGSMLWIWGARAAQERCSTYNSQAQRLPWLAAGGVGGAGSGETGWPRGAGAAAAAVLGGRLGGGSAGCVDTTHTLGPCPARRAEQHRSTQRGTGATTAQTR